MKNTLKLNRLPHSGSRQLGILAFKFRQLLTEYPKGSLALMSATLITSVILCFTVLRHPKSSPSPTSLKLERKPVGISQIGGALTAASALSQVLVLQSELNGRLSAKHIRSQDSARIKQILAQIKILQSNILSDEKDKP